MTDNGKHKPTEKSIKAAVEETVEDAAERVDAAADEAVENPLKTFLNHQKKAFEETGKAIDSLLPEGFKKHSKEARREFLKGVTVLVDAAVVELEKASKEADKVFKRVQQKAEDVSQSATAPERPSTTGQQKVKVEVD